jgi:hypothetical protein
VRGPRDLLRGARQRLTWDAYGRRYDAVLRGGTPPQDAF